jgi:hypothetical protein
MGTRETVSLTVRHLMTDHGMTNTTRLADLLGHTRSYMSRKLLSSRWSLEDLDALARIFNVTPADLVSGDAAGPASRPRRPGGVRLFEVTFELADGERMTCLEAAEDAAGAVNSITSVWRPMGEIVNVTTREKHYFSVNMNPDAKKWAV